MSGAAGRTCVVVYRGHYLLPLPNHTDICLCTYLNIFQMKKQPLRCLVGHITGTIINHKQHIYIGSTFDVIFAYAIKAGI